MKSKLAPVCLAAGAILLGHALQLKRGLYTPAALAWMVAALLFIASGTLLLGDDASRARPAHTLLRCVVIAGLVWQVIALARSWPVLYAPSTTSRSLFRGGMLLEALWLAAGIVNVRALRRVWFPAVLAIHLLLGVWALHVSPSPRIDVVIFHDAAIDALRHGRSPYHIEYENVYGSEGADYAAGTLVDGRVRSGYPYPPLTLLAVTPFAIVFGDYRLGLLAGLILAVLMIGCARPGSTAKLVAALLLTQPRGLFVLEQGWTEPIALALLAALLLWRQRPVLSAFISGLVLTSKQYMVFGVPFFARLIARHPRRVLLFSAAIAAAALVNVPFLVWDPNGFIHNGLLLQTHDALRLDSLSILSWAARHGLGQGSMRWAIGAGTAAAIACWLWAPKTLAGTLASLAASTMVSFAFGSKAFANYYVFVIGAVCCAIVATLPSSDASDDNFSQSNAEPLVHF